MNWQMNFGKSLWAMVALLAIQSCSKGTKDDEKDPGDPGNPGNPQAENAGWTRILANAGNLEAVFFLNDSTGYVCGQKIARTTDRGNTWLVRQPTDTRFFKCWFTDAQRGWVLGETKLHITVDSGKTWTSFHYPASEVSSIQFLNAQTGYLGGKEGLFKSIDGGLSWTNIAPYATYVSDLSFIDPLRGWFIWEGKKMDYTNDGGALFGAITWAQDSLRKTQLSEPSKGWRIDKNGVLAFSDDNGSTWWGPQQFGVTARQFQMVNFQTGFVLQQKAVMKLKNNQQARILNKPDENFTGLHFTNEEHGWAVTSDGIVYRYVKP